MPSLLDLKHLRTVGKNIRLHGNRFIQIDLSDSERVHIWADILPQAQSYPTPIHNHSFDFESEVLAGTLINTEYIVSAFASGNYACYSAMPREGADTELQREAGRFIATPMVPCVWRATHRYRMRLGAWHASSYIGYAITHMRKGAQRSDAQPGVLCPVTAGPDNVFNRYCYPDSDLWGVVRDVLAIAEVSENA